MKSTTQLTPSAVCWLHILTPPVTHGFQDSRQQKTRFIYAYYPIPFHPHANPNRKVRVCPPSVLETRASHRRVQLIFLPISLSVFDPTYTECTHLVTQGLETRASSCREQPYPNSSTLTPAPSRNMPCLLAQPVFLETRASSCRKTTGISTAL